MTVDFVYLSYRVDDDFEWLDIPLEFLPTRRKTIVCRRNVGDRVLSLDFQEL